DGKFLVSGGHDGLRLWDAATLLELASERRANAPVLALVLSPDGRTLVVFGRQYTFDPKAQPGPTWQVWDVAPAGLKRRSVQLLPAFKPVALAVEEFQPVFLADGRTLLQAGKDGLEYW